MHCAAISVAPHSNERGTTSARLYLPGCFEAEQALDFAIGNMDTDDVIGLVGIIFGVEITAIARPGREEI